MSVVKIPSSKELVKDLGLEKAINLLSKTKPLSVIARDLNIPYFRVMLYSKGVKINSTLKFNEVADIYNRISLMSSIKGKTSEMESLLSLPISYEQKIRLLLGRIADVPLGVGDDTVLESLRLAYNISKVEMSKLREKYGDVGDITYKKVMFLASIFKIATNDEAKYIARLCRRSLNLHIPSQSIVALISRKLRVRPDLLREATLTRGLLGGLLLASKGNRALLKAKLSPSKFLEPQLAIMFDRSKIVFPVRVEVKYDGVRCQVHKIKDRVFLFSRAGNLKNNSYPSIVNDAVRTTLSAESCILDSEIVGVKNGNIIPFYEGIQSQDKCELTIRFFDVLYYNGINLLGRPLKDRLSILYKIVPEDLIASGFTVSSYEALMSKYDEIVSMGHEGIMVKSLSERYHPGRRHRSWMKLKKSRDTLDVVLVKANYGSGELGGLYSSFRMAVKHPSKMLLYEIGNLGGIERDTLQLLSEMADQYSLDRRDKEGVYLLPRIVVEVSFYEVIRSSKYPSGFSLRSPNLVRIRYDKTPNQIDTISKVRKLYSLKNL